VTDQTRDPLAAFDPATVERVAAAHDLPADRLRDRLAAHQRSVRALPGVDDIVYEWRRSFPGDPVVERRPDAYLLVVAAPVWAEFADALDFDEATRDAVRAVHRETVAAVVEGSLPDGDPVVLTRP
jgi:hypothetical protein